MNNYLKILLIIVSSFLYYNYIYIKNVEISLIRRQSIECIESLKIYTNGNYFKDKNFKNDYYDALIRNGDILTICSLKIKNTSFYEESINLFDKVKILINDNPLNYKDEFNLNFLNNNILFYIKTSKNPF